MTVDRRRFLQLATLGIAGVADSACGRGDSRDDAALARPQLLAMLGPERVRQLGARYRAATPSEASADAPRTAISNGHRVRIPSLGIASLDAPVRDHSAPGRTTRVDGR